MATVGWDEVVGYISGLRAAHVATVGADGEPHAAKVGFGIEGEHLWFATFASSGKGANLRANPHICVMFEGNQAESHVWGEVELVDDVETKTRIWESGMLPYDPAGFFGSPDNPRLVMGRVTPTRALVRAMTETGPGRFTWPT